MSSCNVRDPDIRALARPAIAASRQIPHRLRFLRPAWLGLRAVVYGCSSNRSGERGVTAGVRAGITVICRAPRIACIGAEAQRLPVQPSCGDKTGHSNLPWSCTAVERVGVRRDVVVLLP